MGWIYLNFSMTKHADSWGQECWGPVMNLFLRALCLLESLPHCKSAVVHSSWLSLWGWRQDQGPLQQDVGTCFLPQIEFLGQDQAAADWARAQGGGGVGGGSSGGKSLHFSQWLVKVDLELQTTPSTHLVWWDVNLVRRRYLEWVESLSGGCVVWLPSAQVNLAVVLLGAGLSTLAENLSIIIPSYITSGTCWSGACPCSPCVLSFRVNWRRGSKIFRSW